MYLRHSHTSIRTHLADPLENPTIHIAAPFPSRRTIAAPSSPPGDCTNPAPPTPPHCARRHHLLPTSGTPTKLLANNSTTTPLPPSQPNGHRHSTAHRETTHRLPPSPRRKSVATNDSPNTTIHQTEPPPREPPPRLSNSDTRRARTGHARDTPTHPTQPSRRQRHHSIGDVTSDESKSVSPTPSSQHQ